MSPLAQFWAPQKGLVLDFLFRVFDFTRGHLWQEPPAGLSLQILLPTPSYCMKVFWGRRKQKPAPHTPYFSSTVVQDGELVSLLGLFMEHGRSQSICITGESHPGMGDNFPKAVDGAPSRLTFHILQHVTPLSPVIYSWLVVEAGPQVRVG